MSCATGAIDLLLHPDQAFVAVLMRVPVEERDVLGGDLDVARPRLDQPSRQQAAEPESAHHLALVRRAKAILLRAITLSRRIAGRIPVDVIEGFEREIERLAAGDVSSRCAFS